MYDQAPLLNPSDRQSIFHLSIDQHIDKGPKHVKQWIRRNAKTLKKLHAIRKKNLSIEQPMITQFFPGTSLNKHDQQFDTIPPNRPLAQLEPLVTTPHHRTTKVHTTQTTIHSFFNPPSGKSPRINTTHTPKHKHKLPNKPRLQPTITQFFHREPSPTHLIPIPHLTPPTHTPLFHRGPSPTHLIPHLSTNKIPKPQSELTVLENER